jgi:hypothetical protein
VYPVRTFRGNINTVYVLVDHAADTSAIKLSRKNVFDVTKEKRDEWEINSQGFDGEERLQRTRAIEA